MRRLARSRDLFIVRLYTGRPAPYPSVEEAESYPYNAQELAIAQHAAWRSVVGTPEQVREAIRPSNIHLPETGLVCIENTHNRHGGTCCTPEEIAAVAAAAHEARVPVHLDGARLFNAAVALGRPVADFARPVDSLTFCLSKGLGAPVGSVVVTSAALAAEARVLRAGAAT